MNIVSMIAQDRLERLFGKGLRNGYKYRETFIVSSIVLPFRYGILPGRGRATSLWRQRSRKTGSGPAAFIIFPHRYPSGVYPRNGLIHKLQIPEFQNTWTEKGSSKAFSGVSRTPFVYFKWKDETTVVDRSVAYFRENFLEIIILKHCSCSIFTQSKFEAKLFLKVGKEGELYQMNKIWENGWL